MKDASEVIEKAAAAGVMIATAESCTGGMVAAALTDIPGSSAVLDRGYVTYSNNAKSGMLQVDPAVIQAEGAVSEAVVRAMAMGAAESIDHDGPRLAVSVSGIAGPDGGTPGKPVGLVWFGLASLSGGKIALKAEERSFDGDRGAVRTGATRHALTMLLTSIEDLP